MKLRTYLLLFVLILIGIYFFSSKENLTKDEITLVEESRIEKIELEKKIAYITQKRIINADSEPNVWLSYGRNYEEHQSEI